ncbi:hypothetical protein [Kitasatospora sp. DSM 101779]|uniref:hypothetical protein n=1 Tax=Kitasatospora sp. DSM 101779 TaxID=2853165 RepID=UPI0021D80DA6|nr:hypothetical protein [Kitasatospora sp. DSM 101779]MCU7822200.1 hypothetical protein [Kitasatospora sp. DSM 101779]
MSDTTTTVVEVAPAPPTTTPTAADKPTKTTAAPAAAVPGLPLAVAAVNTAGGLTAGALALGGPATLATTGVVAGAAAVGALARRARANRARTRQAATLHHTPRQAAGHRTASRPAPLGSVPQARRTGSAASGTSGARSGRAAVGGGAAPARSQTRARAHRATATPGVTASRHRPAPASTGRGSSGPAFTLAKAARTATRGGTGAGATGRWPLPSPQRTAKTEARTARNLAKGHAKAMRRAGIDPATGAATRPARPGKGSAEARAATPEQAKKLRRSAWRYRARMTAAGLATGLVGAASVAAFNWRHPGRVSSHMRRTWQRLATRARAVREARDAAILGGAAGTPDASAVPVPAESVQQPGTASAASALKSRTAPALAGRLAARISIGKPTVQEATVSDQQSVPTFSLSSAADVMLQAASTFDPEHMTEFGVLADDLPVAFATIQEVLRVLAEQGRESLPLDPVVSEEIAQGYQAMGRVVSALENVAPVFRQAHADDLERNENPRNGLDAERKWNVQ